MPTTTAATPHRSREQGSSLVVALLALVVMTLLGLSLALVTSTESSLGDRERSAQRVFYAAEAGFPPAVSRALLDSDHTSHEFSLAETNPLGLHNEVEVSSFFPILAVPCDLCEVHNIAVYNSKQYYEVTHAVTSRGMRVGDGDEGSGPIAQKTVSVMVDVQPTEALAETFYTVMNEEEMDDFRF
jgi:Tfp pilus assembly protein PilX